MTDKLFSAVVNSVTDLDQERRRLNREVDLLVKGAATQATTIRQLRAELETVTANVAISEYNVEFLKRQGRMTRLKLRAAKRGRKQAEATTKRVESDRDDARSRVLYIEQDIGKLRIDAMQSRTKLTNRELEVVSLQAAIQRIQGHRELPFLVKVEANPVSAVTRFELPFGGTGEMVNVEVKSRGMVVSLAPEHARDLQAHAHTAKRIAHDISNALELEVLRVLRGTPVTMKEVQLDRMEKMRAGITGTRADFIIADDVGPVPLHLRKSWMPFDGR